MQAIRDCIEKGEHVALVTGRIKKSLLEEFESYSSKLHRVVACVDGQLEWDCRFTYDYNPRINIDFAKLQLKGLDVWQFPSCMCTSVHDRDEKCIPITVLWKEDIFNAVHRIFPRDNVNVSKATFCGSRAPHWVFTNAHTRKVIIFKEEPDRLYTLISEYKPSPNGHTLHLWNTTPRTEAEVTQILKPFGYQWLIDKILEDQMSGKEPEYCSEPTCANLTYTGSACNMCKSFFSAGGNTIIWKKTPFVVPNMIC